ncbi:MAG: signal peptidase I [Burkholderiaceae bacterium]|nr:signal peptidase I [Microbacteriaceae bacterium]
MTAPTVDVAAAPTSGGEAAREKSLLGYLGVALSGCLLVLVLALAALVVAVPAIVGGSALTVLTQSMEPRFPPGTLIVVKPTPVDEIRLGDVLTYQIESGNPAVVSHRVISRAVGTDGSTTFLTQGDNNDLADPTPVQEIQITGTLWYAIPYLGYVNNVVGGEGRAVVVPVVAAALFIYAITLVLGSVRERRARRSARRH